MQKNKSPIALRIISVVLLLGWMGLIFYLSGQNADQSSGMSGGLIEYVIKLFTPNINSAALEKAVESLQFIVRKSAHFTAYGVLGLLGFISVVTYHKIPLAVRCAVSLVISVLYSVSDEYHQTFVSGRSGELRDIFIDSLGALTGIIFALIIYKIYKAIKNRRSGKMKKKQYIELTETLSRRLNLEKRHSDELSKENSALNKELAELRQRIIALENAKPIVNEPESVISEPVFQEKPVLNEPKLSDGINDGAKIIGKIVVKSAEYCNKLTDVGATANAKELVNLILGRTEVAKSEILRLSSLDIDPAERLTAMERELHESEDYFKSVMAQKI